MKWINRLYIYFLGIIFSITVGFGIAAFYPQPLQPTYPLTKISDTVPLSCNATPKDQATIDCQQALAKQQEIQIKDDLKVQKYNEDQVLYENVNAGYTRTAIFLGIVMGAIFALLGIAIIKKSKLVANGLLLAGILTALLTRFLINLASLGASTIGTSGADNLSYIEFFALLILSIIIVFVGLFSLKETPEKSANRKK